MGLALEARLFLIKITLSIEAPETGTFNEAAINMGQIGDTSRWRAKEERRINMWNEMGFWEGGVMPNTCSDITSLASFQP